MTTPTFTPIRPRRNPLPIITLAIALVAIGAGFYLALTTHRTTLIAVWARPVAAGQPIQPEDLTTLAVPADRPPALEGIADPALLVGQWTTRSVGQGEIIYPSQVQASAPSTPYYPNGEALPEGFVAVPFSLQTVGPVTDRDYINVNVIDPSGDPRRCSELGGTPSSFNATMTEAPATPVVTCRLIPQMEILYVDQAANVAYLAATPYQSQVIYTLTAQDGTRLYGERYGATSPALPYLTRLDPNVIDPALLTGSVSETLPLLPGIWPETLPGTVTGGGK